MRKGSPPVGGPTRRLVTAGTLGGALLALAGCGIRLEDDAPRVPLVPTREPIPAERALVALQAAVATAASASLVTSDPLARLLPSLHARQATVLHDALRRRGVPADALARPSASPTASPASPASPATSATTPSGSPTATTTPSVGAGSAVPRTVTEVESSVVAAGTGLAGAEAELRPTLVAILGQARAALELTTATTTSRAPEAPATPGASPTPSTSATPSPQPSASDDPAGSAIWSEPEVVAPLVTATRRATFLLEVAASRSPRAVGSAWLRDIGDLQVLTNALVEAARDAAPPPHLGQTLPGPVTTPAEAAALASTAAADLLAAVGTSLRALTEADPDAALAEAPRWLGTVAAVAHRHGTTLTPFPGLA